MNFKTDPVFDRQMWRRSTGKKVQLAGKGAPHSHDRCQRRRLERLAGDPRTRLEASSLSLPPSRGRRW